jgi:prevent-host-death family protein
MVERIGAREARSRFSDILGNVHYGRQEVIVERSGKPLVAIIPVEMYERLIAEREARFQVIDRIRSHLPEVPHEEVQRDVAEAIASIRSADAKSGA